MSIASKIAEITAQLPSGTRLVAVSKFHPADAIREAYDAGQRIFGENHVQEMTAKYTELPKDIEWHFIGHLQTNKVKYIAPFVSLIHSVDSERLLDEIEKQAVKCNRQIPVLLELHVAQEETKFGFSIDGLRETLKAGGFVEKYPHVLFSGIMGMASHVDDEARIRADFHSLAAFFNEAKAYVPTFKELSMGMSGDFLIAIEEGSTMVRIGTSIFGERNYA
ncbi:MAG: YggS family pyridoxal phosphate-dependent enzyme [Paludibacteraceae bacterium]|nr:YggS family pyridoxal phosphate-dependent enzyme [Paludibacteraceae bacterium]